MKAIEFNIEVNTARVSPVTFTQILVGKLEKMKPVGRILFRWEKDN